MLPRVARMGEKGRGGHAVNMSKRIATRPVFSFFLVASGRRKTSDRELRT